MHKVIGNKLHSRQLFNIIYCNNDCSSVSEERQLKSANQFYQKFWLSPLIAHIVEQ